MEENACSVSEIWTELLRREEFSFTKDIEKDFFIKSLSMRWLSSLLKNRAYNTFLEAGCFLGKSGIALATTGAKVTLMDCSEKSLTGARRLKEIAEQYCGPLDVTLVEDNLEQTHFKNEQFDVVFNEGVVEHWLDYKERVKIIEEMVRIAKKGGLVSIRVINTKNFLYNFILKIVLRIPEPPHFRYNLSELKKDMTDAGLEIIDCDGETINDPKYWIRNKFLVILLAILSNIINHLPKILRKIFCPSIFCNGIIKN